MPWFRFLARKQSSIRLLMNATSAITFRMLAVILSLSSKYRIWVCVDRFFFDVKYMSRNADEVGKGEQIKMASTASERPLQRRWQSRDRMGDMQNVLRSSSFKGRMRSGLPELWPSKQVQTFPWSTLKIKASVWGLHECKKLSGHPHCRMAYESGSNTLKSFRTRRSLQDKLQNQDSLDESSQLLKCKPVFQSVSKGKKEKEQSVAWEK